MFTSEMHFNLKFKAFYAYLLTYCTITDSQWLGISYQQILENLCSELEKYF